MQLNYVSKDNTGQLYNIVKMQNPTILPEIGHFLTISNTSYKVMTIEWLPLDEKIIVFCEMLKRG